MTAGPLCYCNARADVVVRMRPRRDMDPLTPATARAICLPGQSAPTDVPTCTRHLRQTQDHAISVLSLTPVAGQAVVSIVLKDQESA